MGDFRSRFEENFAKFLKKLKVPFRHEPFYIEYTVPEHKRKYLPDFVIEDFTNSKVTTMIVIETKGRFTGADRKKILWVKQSNPDLDLRLVFMRDNPLQKGSKTKYSDWCKKHGIDFYVGGEPPKNWFSQSKGEKK